MEHEWYLAVSIMKSKHRNVRLPVFVRNRFTHREFSSLTALTLAETMSRVRVRILSITINGLKGFQL